MGAENALDLDALKAHAEAATPGPWAVDDDENRVTLVCPRPDGAEGKWYLGGFWPEGDEDTDDQTRADAAFVAACNPQTALSLIAALEAERVEVARLRDVETALIALCDRAEASAASDGARAFAYVHTHEIRRALRAGAPQQKDQQQ